MEKEEKINKVKETIRVFFQVLSFIHWIIAIICGSVATVILVIIMPTISLLVAILLGVVIMVLFAAFIAIAKIVMLKKREIALMEEERSQVRDIEEQRKKDERGPAKESLKRSLNKFITYWEEGKESILERSQKREEELKNNLFEIGNELKKKVDEKENLLPQTIVEKAEDIAEGIINLSNKLRPAVETRRIQMQEYTEGEKLAERAKELIKEIEKL